MPAGAGASIEAELVRVRTDLQPMETNPHKTKGVVTRLARACRYSVQGLAAAFLNEPAFRYEVLAAAVLIPVAIALDVSRPAKALMIASLLIVMLVELLNSAVEAAVDRISLERHPLAGRAKDLGSAAVAISLVAVAVIWGLCLLG